VARVWVALQRIVIIEMALASDSVRSPVQMEHADALAAVCRLLSDDKVSEARATLTREYPFARLARVERKYNEQQSLRVFIRDGFVDRYSGQRLIFPGTLRLLSELLRTEFPFQSNWKLSETHFAYWELFPTLDHVVPVGRGGEEAERNWVTTSMLRNAAKAHWTLEELGWALRPAGDIRQWDGLLSWFQDYVRSHPNSVSGSYLRTWHRAALSVTAG
jgi:hypothetical protein